MALSVFKRLRRLFERRWPEGQPIMLADGTRWGTRMSDGSIILAPGTKFTPFAVDPSEVTHIESRRFSPGEIVGGAR